MIRCALFRVREYSSGRFLGFLAFFGIFPAFLGLFLYSFTVFSSVSALQGPTPTETPAPTPQKRYMGLLEEGASPETVLPPEIYMGDVGAPTIFVSPEARAKLCGEGPIACVRSFNGVQVLILPNPCKVGVVVREYFTAVTCHEIGHLNGWPPKHGPPPPAAAEAKK